MSMRGARLHLVARTSSIDMARSTSTTAQDESASKPVHRKAGRCSRARIKRDDPTGYLVRVTGWDFSYFFRPAESRRASTERAYEEIATLELSGEIIRPVPCRYARAKVTLSARAGLFDEKHDKPPKAIGSLTASGDTLDAYVFVPEERIASLAAVAASGRIQIAHFFASPIKYRSATVINVSFDTNFIEDDW